MRYRSVLIKKDFIHRIVFRIESFLLLLLVSMSISISIKNVIFVSQVEIGIVLIFCLYLDVKSRKISNIHFKDMYLFSIIPNLIEILRSDCGIISLFFKATYIFIVFFITLVLFSLSVIGGSDGKLIILIFIILPVKLLSLSFVMTYFLFFSIFFIIFHIIHYSGNVNNKISFKTIFDFYLDETVLKKAFIRIFYSFLNVSELENKNRNKYQIVASFIVYNNKSNKFQIMVQYRAPMVVVCIISYYLAYFLIIGI